MKKLLSRVSSLPIHPFLVAAFPVVFLYAQNIGETGWDQIVVPITASVLCAVVAWTALAVLLRDKAKAALATSMLVFLFFSYGHLYDLLGQWGVAYLHKHSLLIPLLIFMWGYAVYFISLLHWNLRSATRLLNIVTSALIALNLVPVLFHSIQGVRGPALVGKVQAGDLSVTAENLSVSGPMPDIYYIILDEYANPNTMAELYSYDNSQFVADLTSMGFFVASESRTRTANTVVSIASSLNMEYLDYQEPCEAVYEKIANNRVVDFLKAYGYQYVYFGNWYDIGRYEVPADVVFNFYSSGYNGTQLSMNDFQGVLLNTTMLRAYNDQIGSSRYESYYRRGLIETLEQLQKAPTMDGPKFVFAHILCPHQPFVFGPRGERVDYADWYNYRDRQFYLGQYVFISQQIETVLDTLVSESEVPPIIVLQSDHGLRSRVVQGLDVGSDWQKILNAYYLPGNGSEQPYDSMSPVNSFRFIFNHYYDADYTLIED